MCAAGGICRGQISNIAEGKLSPQKGEMFNNRSVNYVEIFLSYRVSLQWYMCVLKEL